MTNIAKIMAGGAITADDVRNVAPLSAYKNLDESVTSLTLQNDDAIVIALDANTAYFFVCSIDYEGGTLGSSDFQWKWSLPAGATMRYNRFGIDTAGAAVAGALSSETSNPNAGTDGAGTLKGVLMVGTVSTAGTPGNMQFQWAQHSGTAVATTVHAGSVLAAWDIT